MGPMVDPQAMSDLTQNSCVGMPRLCASSLHRCTHHETAHRRMHLYDNASLPQVLNTVLCE